MDGDDESADQFSEEGGPDFYEEEVKLMEQEQ